MDMDMEVGRGCSFLLGYLAGSGRISQQQCQYRFSAVTGMQSLGGSSEDESHLYEGPEPSD